MRFALPLLLTVAILSPLTAHAKDPSNVDASKQATQVAPGADNVDNRVSPGNENNQRTFIRNDHVQEQRFSTPELIERKDAAVGDKRAPIDMKEKNEKTIVDRKEAPKPELKDHVTNRHDGEKSYIQPKDDQIKKYDTVTKYQDKLKDAETTASQRQPKMEKRTTFEKVNRFIFKRNAPGADDGKPMVTTAGAGENPPASASTYKKYNIDWKGTNAAPVR